MKSIDVNLNERSYRIYLDNGVLSKISNYINLNRKVFIISDDGVPSKWVEIVKNQCLYPVVLIVPQGESSKSFEVYEQCLRSMIENHFTRNDCVVAVGGGVVGDLAGFVAATYMRGVDFYQVPTTTLSQIDSSIGGKVAINVDKVKNCVGAFWQPRAVFVDPNTLSTLSSRHFNNGLIEAVKAGLLSDEALLNIFEKDDYRNHINEILYRSLLFKKNIVEEDEKETGIRKILNLGHTIGHGFESTYDLSTLYHGEAVAMGMLCVIKNIELKKRCLAIFNRLNCPILFDFNVDDVFAYIKMDKKSKGDKISMIFLDEVSKPCIRDVSWVDVQELIKEFTI